MCAVYSTLNLVMPPQVKGRAGDTILLPRVWAQAWGRRGGSCCRWDAVVWLTTQQ